MTNGGVLLTRRLAWISTLLVALLIILGGIVTASASGLGCGADWPTCHGSLIPQGGLHTTLEWSHRLLASIAGVAIVAYAILIFATSRMPRLKVLAASSLTLLALQVVLGEVTVLSGLPAWIVASHDTVALLLLESLLLGALFHDASIEPNRTRYPAYLPAFLALLAVLMGSDLAHLDPACSGLLGCVASLGGGVFPVALAAIGHWVLALGVAASGAWLLWSVQKDVAAKRWAVGAFVLVFLQAGLGVVLLETGLSDVVLAFHEPMGLFTGAAFLVAGIRVQGARSGAGGVGTGAALRGPSASPHE